MVDVFRLAKRMTVAWRPIRPLRKVVVAHSQPHSRYSRYRSLRHAATRWGGEALFGPCCVERHYAKISGVMFRPQAWACLAILFLTCQWTLGADEHCKTFLSLPCTWRLHSLKQMGLFDLSGWWFLKVSLSNQWKTADMNREWWNIPVVVR